MKKYDSICRDKENTCYALFTGSCDGSLKEVNKCKAERVIHSSKEKDAKLLEFIYNRLIDVYKENPNYDYMRGFKNIIDKNFKKPLDKK